MYSSRATYTLLLSRIAALAVTGRDIPCLRRESDPEWWFLEERRYEMRAKSLCTVCPVQPDCLTHAMKYDEIGVWGGLTRNERSKLASAVRNSA
jgi:Transcription factor WhiB